MKTDGMCGGWRRAAAMGAAVLFAVSAGADPSAGPKAGDRMTVALPDGTEMAFRWCPPGTIMMGSSESEADRWEDETRHQVTLTKGFWIGETEVTQAQWTGVMRSWFGANNPSAFKGEDRPVDGVSWKDCQAFIRKANAQTGFGLRLPTEAEWEYACRAGSAEAFNGKGPFGKFGWFKGNSGGETHPVGQKAPNAWGCRDMHGNVAEWCEDWYDGNYPDQPVTDPVGQRPSLLRSNRVLRGGCWDYESKFCRSAIRHGRSPGGHDARFGFRVVCTTPPAR